MRHRATIATTAVRISLLAALVQLIPVAASLTIASAQPKQLPAVAKICVAAFEDISGFAAALQRPRAEQAWEAKLAGRSAIDGHFLLVATTAGDDVSGCCEVGLLPPPPLADAPLDGRVPPDEPYIANVAVAAAARRQGVGRALIDEAERRVCEAGYARLFVKVDRSNFEARRLYDRAGFKIAFVRTKRAEMKFGLPSSKQAQELFLLKSLG